MRVAIWSFNAGRSSAHRDAVDDDVHAERKALGGNRSDRTSRTLEFLAQRCPAVDDEEHVAERIVGDSRVTGGPPAR